MLTAIDGIVAIPMSQHLFMRLAQRYPGGISSVVEQILEDFLDRTQDDHITGDVESYQWDHLRLPSGTKIRTKHYGEYQIGEVVSGKLHWDGKEYPSMSKLARAMRGNTSNNAWVVLELQFPGEATWKLADRLRK